MKNLVLIPFSILVISCGVRKVSVDSYYHNVDSSFTQVKKEQAAESKDSSGVSEKYSTEEKSKSDSSGVKVEFYKSDSSKPTGPVVISTDSKGNLKIDPGGRDLKSVSQNKKLSETKKEAKSSNDSSHLTTEKSLANSDSTGAKKKEKGKSKKTKKTSWQIPWWAYVIVILAIGLTWFFWQQIKSAKKIKDTIIPYSAPNDKS